MVPGIPANSSNPVIPSFCNLYAVSATLFPAPNVTIISFSSFISVFLMSILATIPLIPLSVTNMLLPFPIMIIGVFVSLANLHTSFSSSSFFIVINMSAHCILFDFVLY